MCNYSGLVQISVAYFFHLLLLDMTCVNLYIVFDKIIFQKKYNEKTYVGQ